jgi:hypothetical protein
LRFAPNPKRIALRGTFLTELRVDPIFEDWNSHRVSEFVDCAKAIVKFFGELPLLFGT